MKVLLDENLPKRLKRAFQEYEIYTVRDKGWNGIRNGDLPRLMLETEFEVLITFDKNLRHQQNFDRYPLCVIVLTAISNQYKHLEPLVGQIKPQLENPTPGVITIGL